MTFSHFEKKEEYRRQATVAVNTKEISTHIVAYLQVYNVYSPPCIVSTLNVTLKMLLVQL